VTQPPEDAPPPQEPSDSPPFPAPYSAPPPYPSYPAPSPYPQQPPQYPEQSPPYPPAPLYPQQEPWGDPTSPYATAPKPGTNGFAIAALIFGIIPVCFIGVVFAIVALIQVGKSGQKGKGLAIGGLVLSGLWLIAGITAGVLSARESPHRDSTGAISSQGRVSVNDLKVGDCFNGLDDVKVGSTINRVDALPCAKLHEAEAYAQIPIAGSKYPAVDKLQSRGRLECLQKLQAVAPTATKNRELGYIWIYPKKFSWSLGDHHITCVALGLGRRTGSIKE
jgi:hypothetical protein